MNIKAIILMIAGLFVALWMGLAVGNGDYGTAITVAGLTVFAILVSVIGKHYRFEGWAIAIVCACYFVRWRCGASFASWFSFSALPRWQK